MLSEQHLRQGNGAVLCLPSVCVFVAWCNDTHPAVFCVQATPLALLYAFNARKRSDKRCMRSTCCICPGAAAGVSFCCCKTRYSWCPLQHVMVVHSVGVCGGRAAAAADLP